MAGVPTGHAGKEQVMSRAVVFKSVPGSTARRAGSPRPCGQSSCTSPSTQACRLLAGGKAVARGRRLILRYNLAFRLFGLIILAAGTAAMLVFAVRVLAGWAGPGEFAAMWCCLGIMVLPGVFIVTETFRRQVVLVSGFVTQVVAHFKGGVTGVKQKIFDRLLYMRQIRLNPQRFGSHVGRQGQFPFLPS